MCNFDCFLLLITFRCRYLAGVSFYILVLVICEFDFKYKVVPALLVALLVTYNGPNFLAKLRITAEEAVAKKNGEVLYGVAPNNTNTSNTTRNANQGENAPGAETTSRAGKYCSGGWCGALMHSYSEMNLKRKGVMMVAVRCVDSNFDIVFVSSFCNIFENVNISMPSNLFFASFFFILQVDRRLGMGNGAGIFV